MVSVTEFHHEDVPPQQWLDELHSFNIPYAWDVQITSTQRENLVAKGLAELKNWRSGLQDQMRRIQKRYPEDKATSAQRMLAPYKMLDDLGKDLFNQLQNLDKTVKAGRAVPMGFEFGTNIYGDLDTKRWFLGTQEDEYRWRDFLSIEQRYMTLTKEYKTQSTAYENAKQRVKESKNDLVNLRQELEVRKGFSQIGIRLLIVMVVVMVCILLGVVALIAQLPDGLLFAQEVVAAIFFTVGLVGAMIAYQLARRRRFAIAQLEHDIDNMEGLIQRLTEQVKVERRNILPTRQTLKETKLDYDELKATF